MTEAPAVLWAALAAAWAAVLLWPSRRAVAAPSERGWRRGLRGATGRARTWWVRRRPGAAAALARRREQSLLAVVDALGPALEAGLPAATALGQAARAADDPVLAGALQEVAAQARAGTPLGEALHLRLPLHRPLGGDPGAGRIPEPADPAGLELLARAWRLGDHLGAPLAATTRTVGGVMRADIAARRATEAAVTEARMTVRVLMLLPLLGPLLALAVGVSPTDLYGNGVGAACAVLGLALIMAGRWWMARLIEGVAAAGDAL